MQSPLSFAEFRTALDTLAVPINESWRPVIFKLSPDETESFAVFCKDRNFRVIDTLDRQLQDLAAIRFPSAFSDQGFGIDMAQERLQLCVYSSHGPLRH